MILDVLTALRTGEPVAIDDYGEGDVPPSAAQQQLAVEGQEIRFARTAFTSTGAPSASEMSLVASSR